MSNVIGTVIELFANLYQGVVFTFFINQFFTPKFKRGINFLVCSATTLLMFFTITVINFVFTDYANIEILAFLSIMIPFSVFCHKGKLWLRILMPMLVFGLFMSLAMTYNATVSMIFNKDMSAALVSSTVYRYIYLLIFNISYPFVLFVVYRVFKNKISLKKPIDIFTCIVIPVLTISITFLATAVITDERTPEDARIYLGIITLITFIIVFAMFYIMKEITKNAELRALNLVMEREQQLYKNQISNQNRYIEEISHVKHEMKRKLGYVDELIKNNNLEEARIVCRDSTESIDSITPIHNTPNIYLNSILTVIQSKAQGCNTECVFTIKSSLDGVDGCDLLSLLGNITDNAFEAMQPFTGNKTLQITAFEKEHYYIISVKNTSFINVLEDNPNFHSTKADSKHHGHGLKIVHNIVNKYNGNITFSQHNGFFDVSLMLEKSIRQITLQ